MSQPLDPIFQQIADDAKAHPEHWLKDLPVISNRIDIPLGADETGPDMLILNPMGLTLEQGERLLGGGLPNVVASPYVPDGHVIVVSPQPVGFPTFEVFEIGEGGSVRQSRFLPSPKQDHLMCIRIQ